ncbi:Putative Peptidase family M49 [Septoria linicola]|uniref:Dipeptidyl peptidase 3 n=1 Tax=Septoria linicola TaxID=215465 RepID=A0A9Q9EDQ6_9PEZI|nr:putative Peptidase family M49 [Septoria linicola]USW47055.1 Putative Peptidase family M49 [Septoria linicola]
MDDQTLRQYLADDPPTVVPLEIKKHFDSLGQQEQKYAHFISRAAFSGTRVNLRQVSNESEPTYDLILDLHKRWNGDWKAAQAKAGISDDELKHFLSFAAMFLGNTGNYKSFGDSKFIPRIPKEKFGALAATSDTAAKLFAQVKDVLYDTASVGQLHLGYPAQGHVSTYYPDSPDITTEEIATISDFFKEKQLMPENTRLRKTALGEFELLVASAVTDPQQRDLKDTEWTLNEKQVRLVFGDHASEMGKISQNLAEAQKHALNQNENKMHGEYVKSFHEGSMLAHLESQRHWIKDKGPIVECNIGFIETYRDPHGIRGEWEGFVAMVNKERTAAFAQLVSSAPEQIPKLPWPADFEKDTFLSPDFTSLEVLTFAGSGIPAGINIPNYDSVRQTEGFKNVSLGNVLAAAAPKEPTPFIRAEDQDAWDKYKDEAFEVQVGLHELLGHGCGKLLQETEPGVFNFDQKNPPSIPWTNEAATTYYKPGETWGTVFGGSGPSYEECRAESVAMSLCPDYGILSIFGFGDGKEDISGVAGDVLFVCYLQMARAGVAALQFWEPSNGGKWGQAHSQARFAILQVFLEAGKDFCELRYTKDDLSDIEIFLDRNKIHSHGKPAVDRFLQKLNVYKAVADVKNGLDFYKRYTTVNEWFATKLRPEVLRQAKPRKVFVQANTYLEGDQVVLKQYEATPEGMIQSFVDRDYI